MRPDYSKLAINRKTYDDLTICWDDVTVKFFWRCFVCLVKFSYWSKFHVNIITGSGVMVIFFYKGLTRNPKVRNTPAWVLLNIWRQGRVRDTKFRTDVSNEMILNAAKCQSYSFYHFWVIKGKRTEAGRGGKLPRPPWLRLTIYVMPDVHSWKLCKFF